MDMEDIQRRVQFRQGSYMVTIPAQIAHALGMRKNQYVRFAVSKNKVIIKPVESGITKRDVAEADRDSAALDRYNGPREEEDDGAGYMDALAKALARDGPGDGGGSSGSSGSSGSRMEKLRMR
ncbi:MAG: AbrB/MazE/SpoVT family DNA-binding domain-containing protein [Thaumarchaeota archaeon]|nr:AbrB/MazE/SpoVT family DNA-binding domain-containing protein [Nitrososphaerota archaeon]